MSLHVVIDSTTFSLPPSSYAASTESEFRSSQRLREGNGTEVHRGWLYSNTPHTGRQDVVCKIAHEERAIARLDHEARLYTGVLADLQGTYVPRCHGHFTGDTEKGKTSCLVLAYCGEPIGEPFIKTEASVRAALVATMAILHDAGIKHRDLVERHVLTNAGSIMIIDFAKAEEHTCERAGALIAGALAPRSMEFKCSELYQLCRELEFWRPRVFKCPDDFERIILSMTPEILAACARRHSSDTSAAVEAFRESREEILKRHSADDDSGHRK